MSELTSIAMSLVAAVAIGVGVFLIMRARRQRTAGTGSERERRLLELGVFLALEASRSDERLQAEELAAIQRFLDGQAQGVASSAEELVNSALKMTLTPSADLVAVTEVRELARTEVERRFVLGLIAAVVWADGRVKPEEAVFFYRVGEQLGFDEARCRDEFGVVPGALEPDDGEPATGS